MRFKKIALLSLITFLVLPSFSVKAGLSACEFSGQPTPDQIAACQAASMNAASGQGAQSSAPTVIGQSLSQPPELPEGLKLGSNTPVSLKGPSVKELEAPIKLIKEGIMRAEMGYAKSREMGVEVTSADEALLDQARSAFQDIQAAQAGGDAAALAAKLKEMQNMNLQKKFSAFKAKALPDSRQAEINGQMERGLKALDLTIKHAGDYGIDTSELESLRDKARELSLKAKEARQNKELEDFLAAVNQIEELNINDKVNEIIKRLANEKTKGLVEEGIAKLSQAVDDIMAGITIMEKQKIDTSRVKEMLAEMSAAIDRAKEKLASGDNMAAGKELDNAVFVLIPLGNILKDNGVKLASDQMAQLNAALNFDRGTEGLVINPALAAKTQGMLNAIRPEDIPAMKGSLMEFNPELMDRVIAARDKDKNFIDNIMRDVMPLIPEKDRQKTLEGQLGLIEEIRAADRTITQLKQMKQLPKNVTAQMNEVKNMIKGYNFPANLSTVLDAKLADFNDQVQSGQIKSVNEIKSAVKSIRDEVGKTINQARQQKYKQGLIPAKNIDSDSPLYDEVQYLKMDNAIKPDGKGLINLNKVVDRSLVSQIINNTIDKQELKPGKNKETVLEVIKDTFSAYDVRPVDLAKPGDTVRFMKGIGVDINLNDLKKPAKLGQVADIVAEADQRWGR